MTFVVGFILYFLFCQAVAELGPVIIEGLGALFRFFGLVLKVALTAILKGIALLLLLAFRGLCLAGRGARLAAVFLYFLIAELLRGADEPQQGFDDQDGAAADPDEDDDNDADLYQAALTLLGLPPRFTRAELDAAFKAAIRKAHPDAGGSVDQAQAVNAARDLLLPRALWPWPCSS